MKTISSLWYHYGIKLAVETGADPEIVELAAYLHDFSFVIDDMNMEHMNQGSSHCREAAQAIQLSQGQAGKS